MTIIQDNFFGRVAELTLLKRRVEGLCEGYRQNVAVTGGRLSGKTALLQKLISIYKHSSLIPVYVEVLNESFESFAERYIGTLLYSYFKSSEVPLKEDLSYLLQCASRELPRTFDCIEAIRNHLKEKNNDEAYRGLLELSTLIKEESGKPCIVILDEFHNLETLKVKNPFADFGKKIMVQKDTMYIVASSKPTVIKQILSEKLSLLFGNFEIINLEGFQERDCYDFIDNRLSPLQCPEHLKKFLMSFTNQNPFYLSVVLRKIRQITFDYDTNELTLHTIVEALERLIFDEKGLISQYLKNIFNYLNDEYRDQDCKKVLIALSRGCKQRVAIAKEAKIGSEAANTILSILVKENIIHQNNSFFFISDTIMEYWLKHVVYRKENTLMSSVFEMSHDFKQVTRLYIEDFLNEAKKDVFERVTGLCKLFSNDLLMLDKKNIRLVNFDHVEIKKASGASCFLALINQRTSWCVYISKVKITEEDIVCLAHSITCLKKQFNKKIIVSLNGIQKNAILRTKIEKMHIWRKNDLHLLTRVYGAPDIV